MFAAESGLRGDYGGISSNNPHKDFNWKDSLSPFFTLSTNTPLCSVHATDNLLNVVQTSV